MSTIFHILPARRLPRIWHLAFVTAGIGSFFFLGTASAIPLITSQPQSQIVVIGSSAALNVTATGIPPFTYQWRNAGMDIADKTDAALVFTNIQTRDEGTYSVVVSDFSGSVTSSPATLGSGWGIEWQHSFGGDRNDYAYVVKQTSDGGFVVGGHSRSGVSGNKTTSSFDGEDFWFFKLDSEGNKLWERAFGGTNNEYLSSLQLTSDGGYILSGTSDSGASGNKSSPNFGGYDFWVVKLDANGNKQWEQSLGGDANDFCAGIEQTIGGGYIIAGLSRSDISGNKTNAGFGGFDYWIVYLDSDGNKVWEKTFGGNNDDWLGNIQGTSDGSYLLTGSSISGISGNKTNAGADFYDYWVVKMDAGGNKIWEQTLDSNNTGYYRAARLNADGSKLWDKNFSGDGFDTLNTLERSTQGGFVLGGYSTSEISGDKTSAAFGNGDYWMVGLDPNGNKLWDKSVGGDGVDILSSLQQTEGGGYLLAGYSSSGISGKKTTEGFGGYDCWLVKLVVAKSPIILSQPQSQTNSWGADVTLSVSATNVLSYQWRKDGFILYGATSSSLTMFNFNWAHVGFYDVLVSGINGDLISSNAFLFVSGVETNEPNVSILTPKTNQRITNNLNFNLTGTAKDAGVGVAGVFYRLNNGSFAKAAGTKHWSAPLTLVPGTNKVEVKAVDFGGTESALVSRTFFEVTVSPLTLSKTGGGTLISTASALGTPTNSALLEVGRSYKIQAVPELNNIFSNWTGYVTHTNVLLNFVMQSNMTLSANFVQNPLIGKSGSYNGLFYGSNVTHQTAGFFTMKVKTNFIFSGRAIFDGDAVAMSGKFNVDGTVTKVVSRARFGKPDLTLALALDFADESGKAIGSLSGDGWTALIDADRATFSATNPATSYAKSYTMLLPGFNDPSKGPPGYGYGLITVKTNGFAILAGETADGMKLAQSVPISKNGEWPLYVFLYRNTRNFTNWVTLLPVIDKYYYFGSLLGWVTLTNNVPSGKITSIKTGWTNEIYPNGFTNDVALIGSPYSRPPTGTPAIDVTDGTIILANGNLSTASIGNGVFIKSNNSALITSDDAIKFSLSPKSGLISGTFLHPENSNTITAFKGAVLQGQRSGAGHFLGTNQGGLLLLEGN